MGGTGRFQVRVTSPLWLNQQQNKMLQQVKNYKLTTLLVVIVWTLCFMRIPETPLDNVRLIDKWTHAVMYLALGLAIVIEHNRANGHPMSAGRLLVYVGLMPTLMGGAIEILQAYCTGGRRSGDWLDLLADMVGAALATLIGMLWARWRANS